jgi:hypothetical protein
MQRKLVSNEHEIPASKITKREQKPGVCGTIEPAVED